MQYPRKLLAGLLPLTLALAAAPASAFLTADFSPTDSKVPSATNLLFSGSLDGTLNIPNETGNPLITALNALDGFATTLPITVTFSERLADGVPDSGAGLDPASVVPGQSVRLFEVDLVNPFAGDAGEPFAVRYVVRELTPGVDYTAALSSLDLTNRTLAIVPLKPLKPKTSYMAALTNGLRDDTLGMPVFPDLAYLLPRYRGMTSLLNPQGRSNFWNLDDATAAGVETLQPLVTSQEMAASYAGLDPRSIVLSWTFTTQSAGDVLQAVLNQVQPGASGLMATGMTTADLGVGLPGLANIAVGYLELPYYLETPADAPEECASCVVTTTKWSDVNGGDVTRYNPTPAAWHTNQQVPVLLTYPNGAAPAGGWPVVIFQHGISSDRTNLLGIADTLASQGFAGVAIDLPLHGVDAESPFYQAGLERHFDIEYPEPIGGRIPSELLFVNLMSPLTIRDNGRQAVADLVQLTATIPTMDLDHDGVSDFDGDRIHIIGHSLGGIFTTVMLAFDTGVDAAVLASTLGQVIVSMPYSGNFGPIFDDGLSDVGILPGTAQYATVISAVQTAVESVDANNYAVEAAARHPILFTEVTTASVENYPADGSVPNSVPNMPLAGTEPLGKLMGLTSIAGSYSDDLGARVFVRFTEGGHSSIINPALGPEVTTEMQYEIGGFLASDGLMVPVNNPDLLVPVAVQ